MEAWILFPIILPIVAGLALLLPIGRSSVGDGSAQSLRRLHIFTIMVLAVSAAAALAVACGGITQAGYSGSGIAGNSDYSFTLCKVTSAISIAFSVDALSRIFVVFISIIWVLVAIYAFSYMKHEEKERRFFAFYIMAYGILMGLSFADNLVTFYFLYELMTLSTMPLVFHNQSHEAIVAALKYLFYSMFGAYCVLFGIYFLNKYCVTLDFTAGGTLDAVLVSGHEAMLLVVVFVMILGFGVKAGMFPMHAWLPSAHPVAPAAASAVLSGIIVKAGVLGIIRVVFYVVGADFIRGTWVQTVWRVLALITVFMGSMLAYREPVFKKRLAYSTVSQVSYILFGLSMLNETAFEGALMQTVFHAVMKTALFLVAGSFIFNTGKTHAEEYRGIGKKMPVTLWSYAFASLALIGIPPTCGFIGKWYLAGGAIESGIAGYAYAAVLLVSALLTAGYLLPVVMEGFFPGKAVAGTVEYHQDVMPEEATDAEHSVPDADKLDSASVEMDKEESGDKSRDCGMGETSCTHEASLCMVVPIVILAAATVMLGLFPNPLANYVSEIAAAVLGR